MWRYSDLTDVGRKCQPLYLSKMVNSAYFFLCSQLLRKLSLPVTCWSTADSSPLLLNHHHARLMDDRSMWPMVYTLHYHKLLYSSNDLNFWSDCSIFLNCYFRYFVKADDSLSRLNWFRSTPQDNAQVVPWIYRKYNHPVYLALQKLPDSLNCKVFQRV